MNHSFSESLQDAIDWLVEGEMSEQERDELFEKLDNEPGAWKRCALAFVEMNQLRNSLKALRDEQSRLPSSQPSEEDAKSTAGKTDRIPARSLAPNWITTLAASLLLAIGMVFGSLWNVPAESLPGGDKALVNVQPGLPTMLANNNPEAWRQVSNSIHHAGVSDGEVIALVGWQVDEQPHVLPIIRSETLQNQLMRVPAATLPRNIDLRLRSAGYEAKNRRQFVSFTGPGGKNEILPIDMLSYQFVGKQMF